LEKVKNKTDHPISEERAMGKKLTGSAFTLIGIVNLFSSITVIYFLNAIGGLFETLMGILTFFESTVSQYTTYVTVGYVFAIIQLITGVVALSAGISMLTKQKRVRKSNGTY
jgi:ABC-type maltose transport system permease subunit